MTLLYFVVLPIISGVIIYTFPKLPIRFFLFATEIALFANLFFAFKDINENGRIENILGAQNPVLGIVLIADSLKLVLIALTLILFTLCFLYTNLEDFFDKKFVMLLFILQGLLCGIFLTDDLFNIYVLLEVATVVVAILIMFKRDSRSTYDGMVYLLSQVICMVFYLFGIGYLYKIFGVLSIEKISLMIEYAEPSSLVLPFSFIMTAICLKSAFFPLYSWLPRAHGTPSAPSAVSAILSGLYVKNGIFLFFTFTTLFSPAINCDIFFTVIGSLTAILGFVFALVQTDIKLILAYSTISQIGLITLGFSAGSEVSSIGAIYHIISHALFKSLLFLTAGMIIKQYKTRDIKEISGVFKTMPLTAIASILGILGIVGAPFLNGSISKYYMQYGAKGSVTEVIMLIVNFGTILVFTKYSYILFGKKHTSTKQDKPKEITVLLLGLLCLFGGILGTVMINYIFASNLSIQPTIYIEKSVTFIAMVIVAFCVFKYFIKKNKSIYKLSKFSLNFQQIIMSMVVFFIVITLSLHMQIA